jgi:hypothetical protein
MPQIIVTADSVTDGREPLVMFRERVNVRDFESDHFAAQLVERLGWAVGDADAVDLVDRQPDPATPFDAAAATSASADFSAAPVRRAL